MAQMSSILDAYCQAFGGSLATAAPVATPPRWWGSASSWLLRGTSKISYLNGTT
jgi:hypothetical protein